ncbi:MAG: hypothetical protein KGZ85_07345 [Ignavibacterium sp.]|nr:hypothetical protein [Ignavibacterium sp.]
MSIKKSFSIIFGCFFFSFIILVLFLIYANPQEAGILGLIIFLFSLFLTILSALTLVLAIIKIRSKKYQDKILDALVIAFRQAVFVSLFVLAIIIFQFLKIIYWWSAASLLLFFIILEVIISHRRKNIIYK